MLRPLSQFIRHTLMNFNFLMTSIFHIKLRMLRKWSWRLISYQHLLSAKGYMCCTFSEVFPGTRTLFSKPFWTWKISVAGECNVMCSFPLMLILLASNCLCHPFPVKYAKMFFFQIPCDPFPIFSFLCSILLNLGLSIFLNAFS